MGLEPLTVGVIGCGNISSIYLQAPQTFPILNIVACADLDQSRAEAQAAKFGVARACAVADLLADPAIEIVINLTIPAAHGEVALAVLEAGKSVYNEKPLAISRADAQRMLTIAAERGLRVGCAPDTFLGGGLQTCRALIDSGAIGRPVAATAHYLARGMETWHPDPFFFFQPGAGPLFDMGPYYLTALASLLGPARTVSGNTRITHAERTITSQPRAGEKIPVNTPTHVTAIIEYASGAVATLITSFDLAESYTPQLLIYGTAGSLRLPDPNTFGGPVQLKPAGEKEWQEVPIQHGYVANSRGIGTADMALAIREGRPHRASGELAYHVLDTMHAIYDSAAAGRVVTVESSCARPEALPAVWP